MNEEKIPRLLHEQFEDLKRLLKPISVKRVVVPVSLPEVTFSANDIDTFLKTTMRQLVITNKQPLAFEEYGHVSKEYRYTSIIDGLCISLIVEEAAVEKSKYDAGVND